MAVLQQLSSYDWKNEKLQKVQKQKKKDIRKTYENSQLRVTHPHTTKLLKVDHHS